MKINNNDYEGCYAKRRETTDKSEKKISKIQKKHIIIFLIAAICVSATLNILFYTPEITTTDPTAALPNVVPTQSQPKANIIEMGRKLHLSILEGHKRIDPYYREPYIFGGFSPNPQCCIAVPISDWKTLSENEKKSLKAYAASLIPTVKSQPLMYANINSNAPIAPKIKDNVLKMSGDSWNIMLGDISSNGKDISPDMYVR